MPLTISAIYAETKGRKLLIKGTYNKGLNTGIYMEYPRCWNAENKCESIKIKNWNVRKKNLEIKTYKENILVEATILVYLPVFSLSS